MVSFLSDDFGWGDVGVLFQKGRDTVVLVLRSKPYDSRANLVKSLLDVKQLPNHYEICPVTVALPCARQTKGKPTLNLLWNKPGQNREKLMRSVIIRSGYFQNVPAGSKWKAIVQTA